jgi:hypothetical protein
MEKTHNRCGFFTGIHGSFLLGKTSGRGKSDGWCPLLLRAERQTEACPEKEESLDDMMI